MMNLLASVQSSRNMSVWLLMFIHVLFIFGLRVESFCLELWVLR